MHLTPWDPELQIEEPEAIYMGLRDRYAWAISQAKGKFDGSAQERDGKLYFGGSVKTEAEKNEIWTAIKTIPEWRDEVVARHQGRRGPGAGARGRRKPTP